jgi:predicted membrane protein
MIKKDKYYDRGFGIILTIMGILMIIQIPDRALIFQKSLNFSENGFLFFKFCLYMIAVLLVIGGVKKLLSTFKEKEE